MRETVNRLGRLINGTIAPAVQTILSVAMEMIINLFCHGLADAGDAFQLPGTGARHRSRRTEMVQQRALAPDADAGNLVQWRATERLGSLRAVRPDREPVGLVTQPLQEIKDRVARIERERRPLRPKKPLAPGVAVRSLGDRHDRYAGDA